ncbi:hypothetical protein [Tateyamaria sp. Alg231-49]|jgi:hypothetical protein|uniref:hypothetical protein n=1 Tax=Tateyamaria sp. Alg231-49 TaxID=1922219 RepID=UPI000D55BA7D|nr:hypothetical protein [Tateyamaria sp. Alg231-49]
MRAKNGGVSFGIAAFLLTFAKPNFPSSPSEAAIHTSCSIGQYGLEPDMRQRNEIIDFEEVSMSASGGSA